MSPEKLLAAIMLVSLTLGAGLQVDRGHLIASLKNVSLLGRALLANIVLVPALGVALAKLFVLPPKIATGFLLMAIAPGVPFVLAQVRKRGGRLGFAVELALVLPIVSVVTIPITAMFVLPAGAEAKIPLSHFLFTLLFFQIVPLLVGIVVGARAPKIAERLGRPLQLLFFLSVIALIVVLFPTLVHDVALVYGSHGMWAMLCLVLLSLLVGWLLGAPHPQDRRVLAIGTGLRNIGLCAVLATTSLRSPTVTATVLTYFVIQVIVVTLVGVYFSRNPAEAA
ncbi:MAG TPA: bile acid:sodium symporter [Candidatus Baltobacteraceae bacterium]|nr:bile acid:sodium symporter [Candidatus Baltobacteraceae bacterium]